MKTNPYRSSIAKRFISLMRLFLICFLIGSIILLSTLHFLTNTYKAERDQLKKKQLLAGEINNDFNQAFFDARGYLALGNTSLRDSATGQKNKIKSLEKQFEKISTSEKDRQFTSHLNEFISYYFNQTLPTVISDYEAGNIKEVVKLANNEATPKVVAFQMEMKDYLSRINQELEVRFQTLTERQTYTQMGFVIFILLILMLLLRIIRVMFRQIGLPLAELARAALEVATGNEAAIMVHSKRNDEIGALSSAFQKMIEKVSEKEQHLILQLNRTQNTLNTLHEGVQLIDSQGRTIQTNNQLGNLFQSDDHCFVGMHWEEWTNKMKEFVQEQDFTDCLKKIIHQCSINKDIENSFIYTMKESKQVIKVYSEGLFHGNEWMGTVLVHRDMTKEFEVDQVKSEFVSTVSHELRTPLASILGFTELMLNRELKKDRQEKYLTTILNEANRLTGLINDFLDVQRMESGKQVYEKKYFDVIPLLKKVIEVQQVNTKKHHIVLESQVSNPVMLGDREKIEQVYTNLINNAIKYSPDGGEIVVQVLQEQKRIIIKVIDHGLGIPEESIGKLFTKFYRVDNSDRKKIGGTGLGLAIVQEIVKAHEGSVTVQTKYGKGTVFTTAFPLVAEQSISMEYHNTNGEASGYQILVVEDDQSLAELMGQELRDSGFHVSFSKNGRDTLEYLTSHIPDAIVLDILLEEGGMDGWGIMEKLKQNETLKNIPIIVSTALDEKEKGFALGAMDFLIKPYKPSQLSKAIMQTLLKIGKVGQILIPEDTNE